MTVSFRRQKISFVSSLRLVLRLFTWKMLKSWRIRILVVLLIISAVVAVVNYEVIRTTEHQVFSDVKKIPWNRVGLLLGTAKYEDKGKGVINRYYQYRIEAAVQLYMAGKIDYIIVSGDNSPHYNEPHLMKKDLVARGVPAERIVLDNAGYRTLDSILRARDVFGQKSFTIISQKFHNERAVYIANHKGVLTVGYNAQDGDSFFDVGVREKLARVKMMIDLLTNKRAQVYGPAIEVP
jgi:SanA protein